MDLNLYEVMKEVPVLALKYHFWFWTPSGLNLDLNLPPSRIQMVQISSFVANKDMLWLRAFLDIIFEILDIIVVILGDIICPTSKSQGWFSFKQKYLIDRVREYCKKYCNQYHILKGNTEDAKELLKLCQDFR